MIIENKKEMVFAVRHIGTANTTVDYRDSKLHLYYKNTDGLIFSESYYDQDTKQITRFETDADSFISYLSDVDFERIYEIDITKKFFTNKQQDRNIRFLLSYTEDDIEYYLFRDYSAIVDDIIVVEITGIGYIRVYRTPSVSNKAKEVAKESKILPLMVDLESDTNIYPTIYKTWDINSISDMKKWCYIIWKGAENNIACSIVTRKAENYPVFCLYKDKYMSLGTMDTGAELNKRLKAGYDTYALYALDAFNKIGISFDMLNGSGCTIVQTAKSSSYGYQYEFRISKYHYFTIQFIGGEFGKRVITKVIPYIKYRGTIIFPYDKIEYENYIRCGYLYSGFHEVEEHNILIPPVRYFKNDSFYVVVPENDITKSAYGFFKGDIFLGINSDYCTTKKILLKSVRDRTTSMYDITKYINSRMKGQKITINYKLDGGNLVINHIKTKGNSLNKIYTIKQRLLKMEREKSNEEREVLLDKQNSADILLPITEKESHIIREGDIVVRFRQLNKRLEIYICKSDHMIPIGHYPIDIEIQAVPVEKFECTRKMYENNCLYIINSAVRRLGSIDQNSHIRIYDSGWLGDYRYYLCSIGDIEFAFTIDIETLKMRVDYKDNIFVKMLEQKV